MSVVFRSQVRRCFWGSLTVALAACGSPRAKDMAETSARTDIPPYHSSAADVLALVRSAQAILAAPSHSGTLDTTRFVRVMPLEEADRTRLVAAYPNGFRTTCRNGRCKSAMRGRAMQATMHVKQGFINNPQLVVSDQVTHEFVVRGNSTIEFCNIEGLRVRQGFVTMPVQGLLLSVENNQATLIVNIATGDDNDDYTCE
jgi:hypothetical protein